MTFWEKIFSNEVLISAVTGWLVAQVLKTLIDCWFNKSFTLERMVGSGGMPSSPFRHGMCTDYQRRLPLWCGILRICNLLCTGICRHV